MDKPSDPEFSYQLIRERIIGLRERTVRKSYYPQLRQRLNELERFRFLLDHTRELIFLFEIPDGRILDFNQPALDASGYGGDELRQLRVKTLFPHFESLEDLKLSPQRDPLSTRANLITRYRDALGQETPVEITLETAMFGRTVYGIIVARDIRERLEVERARKALTDRLNILIESIPDRIAFKDADGRHLVVNQAFADAVGLSPDRIIGRTDAEILPRETAESSSVSDLQVMSEASPFRYEARELSPDGSEQFLDVLKVPLKNDGAGPRGLVCISRDVTGRIRAEEEKKLLEKQLRQAQKMEAVGTLAGGIAHDFNNILSAVLGYTEMVIEDVPEGSFIRRNMEQVLQAGIRAKELVQQILTFSRQREQELKPVKPATIIKEAVRLLRASLPTTITIRQNIRSQASILSDATQFHQILMNLCTNAAHAMRENGGVLTIGLDEVIVDEPTRLKLPELATGAYLCMTVADTGTGIPLNIMDRIFDPFFTTKPLGEGTGMGLSVAHGIVKSHRGAIEVSSSPGEGAEFKVYFPRIDSAAALIVPRTDNVPGGKERILFVDDEEILVEMSGHLLKRLGYEVELCTSSQQALRRFQENPRGFDVVITDMTMPGMTGKELAGRMLKLRPDLPIILCTGFSEQISEESANRMGIRAFILKPIVLNHLAGTIRRVLDADRDDGPESESAEKGEDHG
ncbi:MAG: PAS domain-containing hybrid sensor histidine kinase/response regulator [Desulfobacterales bacterium]